MTNHFQCTKCKVETIDGYYDVMLRFFCKECWDEEERKNREYDTT